MFSDLDWEERSLLIDGVRFDLEQENEMGDISKLETDRFRLYKKPGLVNAYGQVLAKEPTSPVRRMFEIGLWDGGSAVFWALTLMPDVLIGIDMSQRGDSPYFTRVLSDRGLTDRIITHWGVNQKDTVRLKELAAVHAGGELDLVVDDGSHLYGPTKASFEALFPFVRPGGWYIVEDWAWEHMRSGRIPRVDYWERKRSPEHLLHEIIAAGPSRSSGVGEILVDPHLFAVRRREAELPADFSLERVTWTRPRTPRSTRLLQRLRRLGGRGKRALTRVRTGTTRAA
ncbi:MAG: class I SAM-dependent methyltransferase [Acidimicrobiia bacterium]